MSDYALDARITGFIQRLETLDAGERARLKRSAGCRLSESRDVIGLFYHILPYGVPQQQEEIYFLIATMFPLADGNGSGDLGTALRQARKEKQNDRGLDRRVEVLLDANHDQFPFRLRQAVHFLQSNRVRVNWPVLLNDLLYWDHPDRLVQRRWARSYFATFEKHTQPRS